VNCLHFESKPWLYPNIYRHFLYFLSSMLSCLLRFPEKKLCSARPYLQLFVERRMFYLRYLCFFAHSGVQCILCCVGFVFKSFE
jgi:hypothetical protein